jgi:ribosomal protein S1
MLEIGSKITARVVRIEPYGIWLKRDGDDILVMAPDVSWKGCAPAEAARVGDELELVVVRYNYPKRVVVGSLKALHPEENPYRELARREPRDILIGTVRALLGDVFHVDLAQGGAWGSLPRGRVPEELKPGDKIAVRIFDLQVDEGRLTLEFVRKISPGSEAVVGNVPSHPIQPVS